MLVCAEHVSITILAPGWPYFKLNPLFNNHMLMAWPLVVGKRSTIYVHMTNMQHRQSKADHILTLYCRITLKGKRFGPMFESQVLVWVVLLFELKSPHLLEPANFKVFTSLFCVIQVFGEFLQGLETDKTYLYQEKSFLLCKFWCFEENCQVEGCNVFFSSC